MEKKQGVLFEDGTDYYGAIVAVARRGDNYRMPKGEARRNIEPYMKSKGVPFDEDAFEQAYAEFSKAPSPKSVYFKGRDGSDRPETGDRVLVTKEDCEKRGRTGIVYQLQDNKAMISFPDGDRVWLNIGDFRKA